MAFPPYPIVLLGGLLAAQNPSAPAPVSFNSFTVAYAGHNLTVVSSEKGFISEDLEDDGPSLSLTFPRQKDVCSLLTLVTANYNKDDILVETTVFGQDPFCRGIISSSHAVDVTIDGYNTTFSRPLSLDENVRLIGLYAILQQEKTVKEALDRNHNK